MELTTVHVIDNKCVEIYCPFCGNMKKVAADKYKNIKHRITVRCKCGSRFDVQFNFRKSYRKELTTVHVIDNKFVVITCPFCGTMKKVEADQYKNIKHMVTVRCKCDSRFNVQFNFRKSYRKSVAIAGEFMTLSPRKSTERVMTVYDLSSNGLCFKMIDNVVVNIGDELLVKFNLDDAKRSFIRKKVVVRFATDNLIGSEFTELALYEKELGFYLLA
jgi:transcription elongation factor Elf1